MAEEGVMAGDLLFVLYVVLGALGAFSGWLTSEPPPPPRPAVVQPASDARAPGAPTAEKRMAAAPAAAGGRPAVEAPAPEAGIAAAPSPAVVRAAVEVARPAVPIAARPEREAP
jgi:hypothetical protein